jgi:hypothetical protein
MKCVKLERPRLWREVQADIVPCGGRGCLPVVDTNDRCAVGRGRGLTRCILGVGVKLLFYFCF